MEYIIITILAITAATFVIYILANKVFNVQIRLKPLILCAACSLFISVVLPRFVVNYAGVPGTIGFLALFAILFAYLIAYYDDSSNQRLQDKDLLKAHIEQQESLTQLVADSFPNNSENNVEDVKLSANQHDSTFADIAASLAIEPEPEVIEPEPEAIEPEPEATEPEPEVIEPEPEVIEPEPEAIEPEPEVIEPEPEVIEPEPEAIEPEPEAIEPEPEVIEPEPEVIEPEPEVIEPEPEAIEPEPEAIEPEPEVIEPEPEVIEPEPEVIEPEPEVIEPEPEVIEPEPEVIEPEPEVIEPEPEVIEPEPEVIEPEPEVIEPEPEVIEPEPEVIEPEPEVIEPEPEVIEPEPEVIEPEPEVIEPEPEVIEPEPEVIEPEPEVIEPEPEVIEPEPEVIEPEPEVIEPEPEAETPDGIAVIDTLQEDGDEQVLTDSFDQPVSNALDDLIEYAFGKKEQAQYVKALDTFRLALKLYRDSDAAPYVAIEIASLLKNKGAYDEAISLLSESRNLHGLQKNQYLEQELVSTIAYLRITKNILLQNRVGFTPFNQIPADLIRKIDVEFREWRNLDQ